MPKNWLVFIDCLINGHDDLMKRTSGRLYLRCERCGRETSGWTIEPYQARVEHTSHVSRIERLRPQIELARERLRFGRKHAA